MGPVRRNLGTRSEVLERLVVAGGDGLPTSRVALELVELAQPDRGRDIGQPEVVAQDSWR